MKVNSLGEGELTQVVDDVVVLEVGAEGAVWVEGAPWADYVLVAPLSENIDRFVPLPPQLAGLQLFKHDSVQGDDVCWGLIPACDERLHLILKVTCEVWQNIIRCKELDLFQHFVCSFLTPPYIKENHE